MRALQENKIKDTKSDIIKRKETNPDASTADLEWDFPLNIQCLFDFNWNFEAAESRIVKHSLAKEP